MFLLLLSSLVYSTASADPQPCCMPMRYSAVLNQAGGSVPLGPNPVGELLDDMLEVHYDYSQLKQAVVSHKLDLNTGHRNTATVIYDYKNSKMHVITADGKCTTSQIDPNSMAHPCLNRISPNITYGGSYRIGYGAKSFRVNTFSGDILGMYQFSIAVTDDCTPVADAVYGSDGKTASLTTYLFTNVTRSYVNDQLFNVPDECKVPSGGVSVGKRDLEALNIERRVFSYE